MNYNPALVDPELKDLDNRTLLLLNTKETYHTVETLKELKTDFKEHLADFKDLRGVVSNLDCHPKMNPGGSTEECSESNSALKREIIKNIAILIGRWVKRHPRTTGIGTILTLAVGAWMQMGQPVP